MSGTYLMVVTCSESDIHCRHQTFSTTSMLMNNLSNASSKQIRFHSQICVRLLHLLIPVATISSKINFDRLNELTDEGVHSRQTIQITGTLFAWLVNNLDTLTEELQ